MGTRNDDISLILAKAKKQGFLPDVKDEEVDILSAEAKGMFDADYSISSPTKSRIFSNIQRAQFPSVMASPPTVTFGAAFAASSIASNVAIDILDPRLGRTGSPVDAGTVGSNGSNYRQAAYTGGFGPHRFEFETDAPIFELDIMRNASVSIIVDGQFAASTYYTSVVAGASQHYMKVDFGSRKPRRIVLISTNGLSRFLIGPTDTVWKTSAIRGPKVRMISDSIGQQSNAYFITGGPFAVASHLLGWRDTELSAIGGTGFLNNNTSYTTFRDRVKADVLDRSPDVIGAFGGINDQGRQTKAVFKAETTAFYQLCRDSAPNAVIIAGGPWQPKSSLAASANYIDIRDAQLESLSTIKGHWIFLDPLTGGWTNSNGKSASGTSPWITGEGTTGATTSTGNANYYITDGTHPNSDGCLYAGNVIAGLISEAMNALYS